MIADFSAIDVRCTSSNEKKYTKCFKRSHSDV